MLHLPHHAEQNRHDAAEPATEHHSRLIALASVRAEGPPALAKLLLHTHPHSPEAGLQMGALLRALPGVGPIGARDLLHLAHIKDSDLLGSLTSAQRGELSFVLAHAPTVLGSGLPRPPRQAGP